MTKTPLADRMRLLATTPSHPRAAELIEKADALDAATAGYMSDPPTVTVRAFVGAFARARIAWCECTGEDLV